MQEFKILEEMLIILCYFICKQVLLSAYRMEYRKSETLPMSFIVIINNNGPSMDP